MADRTGVPAIPDIPSPVEAGARVQVHPAADWPMAVEHWLACAHPGGPQAAREEWAERGSALLQLGTLFSVVRLPGSLITALASDCDTPAKTDQWLRGVLDGGPVISDRPFDRYYALVPAGMPAIWREQFNDWRRYDVDCLGHGSYLGVPRVTATEHDRQRHDGYWSTSMNSCADLCEPLTVAHLIADGVQRLTEAEEAADTVPDEAGNEATA